MIEQLEGFAAVLAGLASDPLNIIILLVSMILGIVFGALPGLTATLGVALLTTLTYGMPLSTALLALLAMYVGAVYGGSYSAILINIPGTPAAAATALEGHPMAARGEGGKALGLTTTASLIGTMVGTLSLVFLAPVISDLALHFTSFEFCLLALFGIVISGTLGSRDLVYKGWIAGLIGLGLATVGRDKLQSYPRFTFDIPALDSGLEIVPLLIGVFGIPQIIRVMRDRVTGMKPQKLGRIMPGFRTILRNLRHIIRSAFIGIGIGSLPSVGEDVAGWVSYGAARSTSKNPEAFGTGTAEGLVSTETANNACIGGALIPLLSLAVPGSPPAAMLLGAFLLHGINPGPMLAIEKPNFLLEVTAILLLSGIAMWICGMALARQVIKVLQTPPTVFLPVIAVLCVIGSYSLGLNIFNLYIMVPIGIAAYFLTEMEYPMAPLVIGVVLGPMADENLRRALMVSEGSVAPFFTRPVSLAMILVIALIILLQIPPLRRRLTRARQGVRKQLRRGKPVKEETER